MCLEQPDTAHILRSMGHIDTNIDKRGPEQSVAVCGEAVEIRRHSRARRLTLRVDPATGRAWVCAPPQVGRPRIDDFVRRHATWLAERLAARPQARPFVDGALVPVAGEPHIIRWRSGRGRPAWIEDGTLWVTGDTRHLARRVRDHLVDQANATLPALIREKAGRLGKPVRQVSIRDTRSRWGSCGPDGRVSLSWRLVLAPPFVADYVAAHEAAHLVELNHSPDFWALCRSLTDHTDSGRAWLKSEGAGLHRYGRDR